MNKYINKHIKNISYSLFGKTPFHRNPNHTEISQPICFVNQLPSFHMIRALTKSICEQTLIHH